MDHSHSLRTLQRTMAHAPLLALALAFTLDNLAAHAQSNSTTAPAKTGNVPVNLVPANEKLALRVAAIGTQIYECKQAEGKPIAWAFVAPEADLFDADTKKRVGKHYAGPSWEMADGSKITGAVKERADSPVPGAIPHLLLTAKSVGTAGMLDKVTSVQRLATVGGVVPTEGCAAAADLGKRAGVYYAADYFFWVAR